MTFYFFYPNTRLYYILCAKEIASHVCSTLLQNRHSYENNLTSCIFFTDV